MEKGTALHAAVLTGEASILRLLLKHGADVNAVAEKLVKEKRGFYVKTCYYQLVNVCEYFIKVVVPPKFNFKKKIKKRRRRRSSALQTVLF